MQNTTIKSCVIAIVILAASFNSCSNSNSGEETVPVTVEYSERPFMASDYFEDITVLPLDNSRNEAIITSIDRLIFANDRIYIFDRSNKRITAFDDKGKFVASTQNMIGRGPNEYILPTDITYDEANGQILLYSSIPYSMIRLDENLKFISKTETSENFQLEYMIDGKYEYSIVPASYNNIPNDDFLVVTEKGGPAKTILSALNEVSNTDAVGKSLTSTDGVYVGRRFDNTIYKLTNGKISEKHSFDFGKLNFPESIKSEHMSSMEFTKECVMNYVISIKDIVSTESYLIFHSNLSWIFVYDKRDNTCKATGGFRGNGLPPATTHFIPAQGLDGSVVISYPQRYMLFLRDMLERPDFDSSNYDSKLLDLARDENYDNMILLVAKMKQ